MSSRSINEISNVPNAIVTTRDYWPYDYNDPKFLEAVGPAPIPPVARMPSGVPGLVEPVAEVQHHEHAVPPDDHPYHYGRLWRSRSCLREYAGEFFGTMILVMFGTGTNCQYNLSVDSDIAGTVAGTWASVSLAWGAGIALGTLLSGGHINPAVTLAMAVWRRFPWRKVPSYMLCQLLGAICGAAIVYGNYKTAINIREGGWDIRNLKTAGYFCTIPLSYMTNLGCFFDEFIGTTLLVFAICCLLDRRNELLFCVGIFIVFVGIAAAFGMQTGFALNPARDLGPRMLMAMVGYGRVVFTYRHQYWLWSPILATFTGAQLGMLLYDVFIYSGDQSMVNRIFGQPRQPRKTIPINAP